MPSSASISPWLAAPVTLLVLLIGAYAVQVASALAAAATSGAWSRAVFTRPAHEALRLIRQTAVTTERPDLLLWSLAPAVYAAMAAGAFTVVPWSDGIAIADVRTGIVLFGAAEALAIVAIYLHGWAPNSYLPLIGGNRFVALGLSYELLSMFVLIAAALPAESLRVSEIVRAQSDLWNVARQPLGLPLWIVVTLGVTFTGPLDLADGADLEGGTSAEASGRQRLLWEAARGGMMIVFCAMGATVFLGGWLGPAALPGWAWMVAKTLTLLFVVVWTGHQLPRIPASRVMTWLWVVGLPLSFLHLVWAGVEALA